MYSFLLQMKKQQLWEEESMRMALCEADFEYTESKVNDKTLAIGNLL